MTNSSYSFSIHPDNRDIRAYSGLSTLSLHQSDVPNPTRVYASSYIHFVRSNGINEFFDSPQAILVRENVTQITFLVYGIQFGDDGNMFARGHHVVNFWN